MAAPISPKQARLDSDPTVVSQSVLIGLSGPARQLSLDALRVRARRGGQYLSHFKGRGMEFDEARLYQDGDDPRSIDWRLTARTGRAYTKLFREERERPVFCWVDQRPCMQFATRGVFKAVQAARLASLLGWAAIQRGDRLGGFVFNGIKDSELRPALGHRAVLRLIHQMAALQSTMDAPPADPEIVERSLAGLQRVAHPGSLIVAISDFSGVSERASRHLINLAHHNDVLALFLHDPLELTAPPPGSYPLAVGRDRLFLRSSARTAKQWAEALEAERGELRASLERHQIRCESVSTSDDPLTVMQGLMGRVGANARRGSQR